MKLLLTAASSNTTFAQRVPAYEQNTITIVRRFIAARLAAATSLAQA
jgi:hypothetical protein